MMRVESNTIKKINVTKHVDLTENVRYELEEMEVITCVTVELHQLALIEARTATKHEWTVGEIALYVKTTDHNVALNLDIIEVIVLQCEAQNVEIVYHHVHGKLLENVQIKHL